MELAQILIFVATGVILLLVVINLIFRATQKKLEAFVQQRFEPSQIIAATVKANFFGQASAGVKQIRGNGALVLTAEELFFVRAVPIKEFSIPLEAIKEISFPRSFNGKSVYRRLLCVHFEVDGKDDAMAWVVPEPDGWKTAILAQVNR